MLAVKGARFAPTTAAALDRCARLRGLDRAMDGPAGTGCRLPPLHTQHQEPARTAPPPARKSMAPRSRRSTHAAACDTNPSGLCSALRHDTQIAESHPVGGGTWHQRSGPKEVMAVSRQLEVRGLHERSDKASSNPVLASLSADDFSVNWRFLYGGVLRSSGLG